MNTHNEFAKNVQGWGHITLKVKSKKVELEGLKQVQVFYIVKEIEDGRMTDLKKVVKQSMDKSMMTGIFKKRKIELEKKEFEFEEFKELIEDFEAFKHD